MRWSVDKGCFVHGSVLRGDVAAGFAVGCQNDKSKELFLCVSLFHFAVDCARGVLFSGGLALVVKLFALAKTYLHLYKRAFKI